MFDELLASKEYWHIYIIARWCYKNSIEFLSDKVYDGIEDLLKLEEPESDLFKHSYEDDEEPTDLLKLYNINLKVARSTRSDRVDRYIDLLTDTKGISVRPVRTLEEAYEWYKRNNNKEMVHSLKINGSNTKSLVSVNKGSIEVSVSKAVKAKNFLDYTDALKSKHTCLNTNRYKNIKSMKDELIPVFCEAYVDDDGRRILDEEYNMSYVNARSAANAVLRRNLVDLIGKHFHLICYNNLDNYGTFEQGLRNAELMGFEIVPYRVDKFEDRGFEEFCKWVDTIQNYLIEIAEKNNIPYDGIVAQINNMDEYYENYTDLYNDSNIALKFGLTGAEIIEAEVKDIKLVQSKKATSNYSCKILVEPVKTTEGTKIEEITGYNLANIIDMGIRKGSKIDIIYQSGCYPTLKRS